MSSEPTFLTRCLLTFAGIVFLLWVSFLLGIYKEPPGPVWTVLGFVALIVGRTRRRNEISDVTETRKDFARRVFWTLQDGAEPPAFSVYLRSFATDGHMEAEKYGSSFGPTVVFGSRTAHVEEVFANAGSTLCPLIGLGEDQEFPAGGRLTVRDKEWRKTVQILARAAAVIVMVPSDRECTLWETIFLREADLLSKTVFVMPPKPIDGFPMQAEWEKARVACASNGVTLPGYDPAGGLFRITATGPSEIVPMRIDPKHLRNQILGLSGVAAAA